MSRWTNPWLTTFAPVAFVTVFFLGLLHVQSRFHESFYGIMCSSRIIEFQIKEAQKTTDEIIKRLQR